MEKQNANSQDVENCFKMAYLINPQSKSAVINLSSKLLQHGKLHDAMKVLAPAFKANPDDPKIAVNYASLLNLIAVPLEAEKILKKITPQDNPNSKTIYYFQLAESLRRQKKHKEAEAAYSISVKSANKKQLEIITAMRLENEKAAKTESQQKP
jgi:predicted Zn-dependent protease